MKFTPTTVDDVPQLREWIAKDQWHHDVNVPEWWLTGTGYLAFCAQDDVGPTVYVKLEKEDEMIRLHCQFGPVEEVSKRRLIVSMLTELPPLLAHLKKEGFKGVVFNSWNPFLIRFMVKAIKFWPSLYPKGDCVFMFEES